MSEPLPDIECRADIDRVVRAFYRRVSGHDRLGPMFNTHAEVDWYEHLPKMTSYWARVLLGDRGYQGGTIVGRHQDIHAQSPLDKQLFDDWYGLWTTTIEEHHSGPIADKAKRHAALVANVLSRQTVGQPWQPSEHP